MKTVILAAGYATRLYPLTENRPKALLPIGSKPLLNHLVDKINPVRSVQEIVLVTNSRFAKQFEDWTKTSGSRYPIRILDDGTTSNDDRLGAVGDLQFAVERAQIDEDLMVLASDNLFDGSLSDFAAFGASKDGGTIGVFDLKSPAAGAKRYGMVKLDKASRIAEIQEKPEKPDTPFASMGIYYFPRKTLPLIREYLASKEKQDAPGYYVTWLLKRIPMYGYVFGGRWYDIGSIDQLNEASREYEVRGNIQSSSHL